MQETNIHGWHIKKEISIAHIFSTVSVIVGILWWSANINSQIVLLHREDQMLQQQITDVKADQRNLFKEIKNSLIRIENKLDTKADKR